MNLILCDGAALTASKGITVADGNTLNIYGQTSGTGTLTATSGSTDGEAGISGGGRGGAGGNVYIYGGTVTATGGNSGAQGIGGGNEGGSGSLTVSGDHLLVFSGSSANPTTIIVSPYSTRYQYMRVAAGLSCSSTRITTTQKIL